MIYFFTYNMLEFTCYSVNSSLIVLLLFCESFCELSQLFNSAFSLKLMSFCLF